jgi:glycosyltransferase involved in cell wall biosynthesis
MVLGGERVGVGVVAADPNGVVEVGREGGGGGVVRGGGGLNVDELANAAVRICHRTATCIGR